MRVAGFLISKVAWPGYLTFPHFLWISLWVNSD